MTRDPMHNPATDHWTYEDYLKLPDDGTRCEIIEGERLVLSRERRSAVQDRGLFEAPDLDPIARRIEVYVLDGGRFALKSDVTSGEVRSAVVLPGFTAQLGDIFRV